MGVLPVSAYAALKLFTLGKRAPLLAVG